jgi:hypothetical protein
MSHTKSPHLDMPSNIPPATHRAKSFTELSDIAYGKLWEGGVGWSIVCGPLSTGGLGSQEANFEAFAAVIATQQNLKVKIFDQMPYEGDIRVLADTWHAENDMPGQAIKYCMPLLEEFYRPLFRSGFITRGLFIPGWRSSTGAQFERSEMDFLGIEIIDLEEELVIESIRQYRYLKSHREEAAISGRRGLFGPYKDHPSKR